MKTIRFFFQLLTLFLLTEVFANSARAGVLTTLHIFNGADGQYPQAALVLGDDGSYYGLTTVGGAHSYGTVFSVTTNGVFASLASLADTNGVNPYGRLISAGGVLIGTTANGGPFGHGSVFTVISNKISAQVAFTNTSTDGAFPYAGLVADSDGVLYGTTISGGGFGYGTVFKMNPTDTKPTVLTAFNSVNGSTPEGGLLFHTNGYLYGTTLTGGSNNVGTVYKITTGGTLSNLFSFSTTNGAYPWARLVKGVDGNFYGTTANGGPGNYGTVFKVTTNESVEMVAAFSYTNGANPIAELTPAADGSLYGVARFGGPSDYGTIFKVTTNGTIESLFPFNYTKGSHPYGGMVFGSDGHLYGTATEGGGSGGIVFRFVLNPPAPVMQSVTKTNGNVTLTWSAVAGGDYQLQFKTNLTQTNWNNLGFAITATNSIVVAPDVAPPDAQRFYRAVLLQP